MNFDHKTVLLGETIKLLDIKADGVYIDGTAGGGGLSFEIASRLSKNGKLVCIDQDPDAILACKERLSNFKSVSLVQDNFSNIKNIVHSLGLSGIDGIALDLGVSSYQLDTCERGFSYKNDAFLDMRMSRNGESAYDVVNFLNYPELRNIISRYGEEKFASRIATKIVEKREKKAIKTTVELAEIIKESIPHAARREGGHPARRTFQAIRIYVNKELESLEKCLDGSFEILNKGGKMAVITFHSLEDRIVKERMKTWSKGCICPGDFPVCVCGKLPKVKILSKKAVRPSHEEVYDNFRSRSAKLRVCEKI